MTNKRRLKRALAFTSIILLGIAEARAQTFVISGSFTIINDTILNNNVRLTSGARFLISKNKKVIFTGSNFKMDVGAVITVGQSNNQEMGGGTIVFQSNTLQTLDGGNYGSKTSNTIPSISIDNIFGVQLVNSNTRISDSVTFIKGHLYTDVHDLIMGKKTNHTGSAAFMGYGDSCYIVTSSTGRVIKEECAKQLEYVFPVGISEKDYTPAAIRLGSTSSIAVRVANYANDGLLHTHPDGIQRTWNITVDSILRSYPNENGTTYKAMAAVDGYVYLQHNSVTNQSQFSGHANFVTRNAIAPNFNGIQSSMSQWEVNTMCYSSPNGTSSKEKIIRKKAYLDSLQPRSSIGYDNINNGSATLSGGPGTETNFYSAVQPVFSMTADANAGKAWFTKASDSISQLSDRFFHCIGSHNNKDNQLSWSTSAEIATESFEVQYSKNGKDFKKAATVPVDSNVYAYKYLHTNILKDTYYRIKMTSKNGMIQYSNIIKLDIKRPCFCLFMEDERPFHFSDKLFLPVFSCKKMSATVSITDALGKKVWSTVTTLPKGVAIYPIKDLGKLVSGTYVLSFTTKENSFTKKIVK